MNHNILLYPSSIIVLSFNPGCFHSILPVLLINLSQSVTARGTDLPFSHISVVSITHEQNIITLICRQLFADHMVGCQPTQRMEKMHQMINTNIFREKKT